MPKAEDFESNEDLEGNEEEGSAGADPKKAEKEPEGYKIPKERFDEVNNRMKEFEKRAKAAEKALKQAQTSRLEEQEQYKELYEQATGELSELKPLVEQVEGWKETLQKLYNAQVEEIPEEYRQLIPEELSINQKLNWISRNKALLSKPIAPKSGAGEQGKAGNEIKIELTPEQKETARRFGYTEEEYMKAMVAGTEETN